MVTRGNKEMADAIAATTKKEEELLKASEDLWGGKVIDMPAAVDKVHGDLLDFADAQKAAEEATRDHGAASVEAQRALIAQGDAARGLYGDLQTVADVALKNAEAQAQLDGKVLSATDKVGIQRQALEDLRAKFPELGGAIDQAETKFGTLATAAEDAGTRVVSAMSKMRDDLAGIFNSIDIGNGLIMVTATADRLEAQADRINGIIQGIQVDQRRRGAS
jgi:hypothetical protein